MLTQLETRHQPKLPESNLQDLFNIVCSNRYNTLTPPKTGEDGTIQNGSMIKNLSSVLIGENGNFGSRFMDTAKGYVLSARQYASRFGFQAIKDIKNGISNVLDKNPESAEKRKAQTMEKLAVIKDPKMAYKMAMDIQMANLDVNDPNKKELCLNLILAEMRILKQKDGGLLKFMAFRRTQVVDTITRDLNDQEMDKLALTFLRDIQSVQNSSKIDSKAIDSMASIETETSGLLATDRRYGSFPWLIKAIAGKGTLGAGASIIGLNGILTGLGMTAATSILAPVLPFITGFAAVGGVMTLVQAIGAADNMTMSLPNLLKIYTKAEFIKIVGQEEAIRLLESSVENYVSKAGKYNKKEMGNIIRNIFSGDFFGTNEELSHLANISQQERAIVMQIIQNMKGGSENQALAEQMRNQEIDNLTQPTNSLKKLWNTVSNFGERANKVVGNFKAKMGWEDSDLGAKILEIIQNTKSSALDKLDTISFGREDGLTVRDRIAPEMTKYLARQIYSENKKHFPNSAKESVELIQDNLAYYINEFYINLNLQTDLISRAVIEYSLYTSERAKKLTLGLGSTLASSWGIGALMTAGVGYGQMGNITLNGNWNEVGLGVQQTAFEIGQKIGDTPMGLNGQTLKQDLQNTFGTGENANAESFGDRNIGNINIQGKSVQFEINPGELVIKNLNGTPLNEAVRTILGSHYQDDAKFDKYGKPLIMPTTIRYNKNNIKIMGGQNLETTMIYLIPVLSSIQAKILAQLQVSSSNKEKNVVKFASIEMEEYQTNVNNLQSIFTQIEAKIKNLEIQNPKQSEKIKNEIQQYLAAKNTTMETEELSFVTSELLKIAKKYEIQITKTVGQTEQILKNPKLLPEFLQKQKFLGIDLDSVQQSITKGQRKLTELRQSGEQFFSDNFFYLEKPVNAAEGAPTFFNNPQEVQKLLQGVKMPDDTKAQLIKALLEVDAQMDKAQTVDEINRVQESYKAQQKILLDTLNKLNFIQRTAVDVDKLKAKIAEVDQRFTKVVKDKTKFFQGVENQGNPQELRNQKLIENPKLNLNLPYTGVPIGTIIVDGSLEKSQRFFRINAAGLRTPVESLNSGDRVAMKLSNGQIGYYIFDKDKNGRTSFKIENSTKLLDKPRITSDKIKPKAQTAQTRNPQNEINPSQPKNSVNLPNEIVIPVQIKSILGANFIYLNAKIQEYNQAIQTKDLVQIQMAKAKLERQVEISTRFVNDHPGRFSQFNQQFSQIVATVRKGLGQNETKSPIALKVENPQTNSQIENSFNLAADNYQRALATKNLNEIEIKLKQLEAVKNDSEQTIAKQLSENQITPEIANKLKAEINQKLAKAREDYSKLVTQKPQNTTPPKNPTQNPFQQVSQKAAELAKAAQAQSQEKLAELQNRVGSTSETPNLPTTFSELLKSNVVFVLETGQYVNKNGQTISPKDALKPGNYTVDVTLGKVSLVNKDGKAQLLGEFPPTEVKSALETARKTGETAKVGEKKSEAVVNNENQNDKTVIIQERKIENGIVTIPITLTIKNEFPILYGSEVPNDIIGKGRFIGYLDKNTKLMQFNPDPKNPEIIGIFAQTNKNGIVKNQFIQNPRNNIKMHTKLANGQLVYINTTGLADGKTFDVDLKAYESIKIQEPGSKEAQSYISPEEIKNKTQELMNNPQKLMEILDNLEIVARSSVTETGVPNAKVAEGLLINGNGSGGGIAAVLSAISTNPEKRLEIIAALGAILKINISNIADYPNKNDFNERIKNSGNSSAFQLAVGIDTTSPGLLRSKNGLTPKILFEQVRGVKAPVIYSPITGQEVVASKVNPNKATTESFRSYGIDYGKKWTMEELRTIINTRNKLSGHPNRVINDPKNPKDRFIIVDSSKNNKEVGEIVRDARNSISINPLRAIMTAIPVVSKVIGNVNTILGIFGVKGIPVSPLVTSRDYASFTAGTPEDLAEMDKIASETLNVMRTSKEFNLIPPSLAKVLELNAFLNIVGAGINLPGFLNFSNKETTTTKAQLTSASDLFNQLMNNPEHIEKILKGVGQDRGEFRGVVQNLQIRDSTGKLVDATDIENTRQMIIYRQLAFEKVRNLRSINPNIQAIQLIKLPNEDRLVSVLGAASELTPAQGSQLDDTIRASIRTQIETQNQTLKNFNRPIDYTIHQLTQKGVSGNIANQYGNLVDSLRSQIPKDQNGQPIYKAGQKIEKTINGQKVVLTVVTKGEIPGARIDPITKNPIISQVFTDDKTGRLKIEQANTEGNPFFYQLAVGNAVVATTGSWCNDNWIGVIDIPNLEISNGVCADAEVCVLPANHDKPTDVSIDLTTKWAFKGTGDAVGALESIIGKTLQMPTIIRFLQLAQNNAGEKIEGSKYAHAYRYNPETAQKIEEMANKSVDPKTREFGKAIARQLRENNGTSTILDNFFEFSLSERLAAIRASYNSSNELKNANFEIKEQTSKAQKIINEKIPGGNKEYLPAETSPDGQFIVMRWKQFLGGDKSTIMSTKIRTQQLNFALSVEMSQKSKATIMIESKAIGIDPNELCKWIGFEWKEVLQIEEETNAKFDASGQLSFRDETKNQEVKIVVKEDQGVDLIPIPKPLPRPDREPERTLENPGPRVQPPTAGENPNNPVIGNPLDRPGSFNIPPGPDGLPGFAIPNNLDGTPKINLPPIANIPILDTTTGELKAPGQPPRPPVPGDIFQIPQPGNQPSIIRTVDKPVIPPIQAPPVKAGIPAPIRQDEIPDAKPKVLPAKPEPATTRQNPTDARPADQTLDQTAPNPVNKAINEPAKEAGAAAAQQPTPANGGADNKVTGADPASKAGLTNPAIETGAAATTQPAPAQGGKDTTTKSAEAPGTFSTPKEAAVTGTPAGQPIGGGNGPSPEGAAAAATQASPTK